MRSRLIEELSRVDEFNRIIWPATRINTLFREFDLTLIDDNYDDYDATLERILGGVTSDDDLVELYAVALDIDIDAVTEKLEQPDPGNWKPGYARVFLSHSAAHKQLVGEVAKELAVSGIHGFVAHDHMEYSKPWQVQIERALQTMDAFVALAHPEFGDSVWCNQEVGWALGRRVPYYVLRLGVDPRGFIGSDQWPSASGQPAKSIASTISDWVFAQNSFGNSVVDGLLEALKDVQNYYDAEAACKRVASLGTLSEDQFERLSTTWYSNDQLCGSVLATRALKPLFDRNGKSWPPPKAE